MKYIVFGLLILSTIGISAQVINSRSNSASIPERLTLSSFAYPIFLDGEQHSSYALEYTFNSKFRIELQGFYDTYRETDRYRNNLRVKYNLNDHWYVFSGGGLEVDTNKYAKKETLPPRYGIMNGIGYEVKNNFLFEAGHNLQINNSPMGAFGESLVPMPKVYTLGGKLKF